MDAIRPARPFPVPESLGPWLHREIAMLHEAACPSCYHVTFAPDGMLVLLPDGDEVVYHAPGAIRWPVVVGPS